MSRHSNQIFRCIKKSHMKCILQLTICWIFYFSVCKYGFIPYKLSSKELYRTDYFTRVIDSERLFIKKITLFKGNISSICFCK